MMHRSKVIAAALAAVAFVGTADQAAAAKNRYHYARSRHRGVDPGPAIAGAAVGVLGAVAAGVAADRYYNGYPVHRYDYGGPHYRYGYDYIPPYGYYGPY